MLISDAVAPCGMVIKFCTYCTISWGSTRTVKFGCGWSVIRVA